MLTSFNFLWHRICSNLVAGAIVLGLLAAGGCADNDCPNNQAASAPPGAKAPAKSAGTLDKNGRFQKKNAYHPSARHAN
jgi:hypothetical protein